MIYNELGELISPSLEVRAEREKTLYLDNRTPIEKLFDVLTAARISYYRPNEHPSRRQDIVCLCCGGLYRPDDIMNGENMFLCGSCILTRLETEDAQSKSG